MGQDLAQDVEESGALLADSVKGHASSAVQDANSTIGASPTSCVASSQAAAEVTLPSNGVLPFTSRH